MLGIVAERTVGFCVGAERFQQAPGMLVGAVLLIEFDIFGIAQSIALGIEVSRDVAVFFQKSVLLFTLAGAKRKRLLLFREYKIVEGGAVEAAQIVEY